MGAYSDLIDGSGVSSTVKPAASGYRYSSFIDVPSPSGDASDIPQIEASSPQRQNFFQKAKSLVTGEGQKDFDLPEMTLPFSLSSKRLSTDVGRMTTFDPSKLMEIYKNNYPGIKFSQDSKGNIIGDARSEGGNVGYLNDPGLSQADIVGFAGQAAAFTPSGKAAQAVAGILPKALTVGAASGATQVGLDLATQKLSGKDPRFSEVDKGDVAIAAGAGTGGEFIAQIASRISPLLKRLISRVDDETVVTAELRAAYREEAGKFGVNLGNVSDDVLDSYIDATKLSLSKTTPGGRNAASIQAARDTQEFGVRYTRGQQTGDINQLSLEDSLRHGGPEKARGLIQQFDESQADDILRATKSTQGKIGQAGVGRINEAGATIKQGLVERASSLDARIGAAYEEVGDAFLGKDHVSELLSSVKNSVREIDFDQTLKSTAQSLQEITKFQKTLSNFKGIRPFPLAKIEQFRRRLSGRIASAEDTIDRRQATIMKKSFDDYLDTAVDKALFLGDETAMSSLKKARGLRAEYAQKFQRMDKNIKGRKFKDEAGDTIERIIGADPSSSQMSNYLFGVSRLSKRSGEKIANRIKDIVGGSSEEWQMIREAGFLKLLGRETGTEKVSGAVFGKRLNDAIRGESEPLMKVLYSSDEIALFSRLSRAIKRGQPARDNPSGTAYKVSQDVGRLFSTVLDKLGISSAISGDPATAIGLKAAGVATQGIKVFRKTAAAQRAIGGFQPKIDTSPIVTGIGTATALDLANPDQVR